MHQLVVAFKSNFCYDQDVTWPQPPAAFKRDELAEDLAQHTKLKFIKRL